jgi:hypothetical protein
MEQIVLVLVEEQCVADLLRNVARLALAAQDFALIFGLPVMAPKTIGQGSRA